MFAINFRPGSINRLPWLVFEYMEYGDLANILCVNSGMISEDTDTVPAIGLVSLIIEF